MVRHGRIQEAFDQFRENYTGSVVIPPQSHASSSWLGIAALAASRGSRQTCVGRPAATFHGVTAVFTSAAAVSYNRFVAARRVRIATFKSQLTTLGALACATCAGRITASEFRCAAIRVDLASASPSQSHNRHRAQKYIS